ncbi:hypothetical protein DB313_05750 (plasmid) [Borrelia turcica IST7]|uniref:Uncharacterized protein n=1 Tax=Borrelia turcica IST7 TaxID=1104446 RepID=A0A386PQ64_9SPIR|nr:hypothetical protein [Borrelia turcica]AYE37003.1 hypothetical protein DB313_05750 [Borrelia turcica IST7]
MGIKTTYKEYGIEIGWFSSEIASIAKFHELGTSNLVRRSHLYKVFNLQEFREVTNTLIKDAIVNKKSISSALEKIAIIFIALYKDFVLSQGVTPKLLDRTIKAKRRKGSSTPDTPLVDTGRMINSIEYRHITREDSTC